jgi:hypothetical protein
MKTHTFFYVLILNIFLLISNLLSQTSISISQYLAYYSNSFYNYRQLPDVNDNVGLNVSFIFERQKIHSRVYYQGDLNFFKTYTNRLYHNQALGYDGYTVSSDNKKTLYFGTNWRVHDGRDIYDFYDYSKLQGYINSKIFFRPNLIGKFGYILNNQTYSELPEFSYWEHYLYTQLNTFFQTGTSITININYGLKNYIPVQLSSNWRNPEFFDMPSVDQLVSSLKVAQSLGDKTSISMKYLTRLNPGLVTGSATVINTDNLFTEDELFDDRYGYKGHEFSINITHYLPAYIKLELGSAYYLKDYNNRQIYDIDGILNISGDTRSDHRSLIWASLSRSFAVNWGIKNFKLSLQSGYLKNESNGSYYQFDNYFGSLGLQFQVK